MVQVPTVAKVLSSGVLILMAKASESNVQFKFVRVLLSARIVNAIDGATMLSREAFWQIQENLPYQVNVA